jgi:hypothetical protein
MPPTASSASVEGSGTTITRVPVDALNSSDCPPTVSDDFQRLLVGLLQERPL